MNQTWTVTEDDGKKRLDVFLAERIDDLSRSQIKKQIEEGRVYVNGKQASVHHFLKSGDVVEFQGTGNKAQGTEKQRKTIHADKTNPVSRIPNPELRILEETPDWIVVYKPCGILMHPDHDHEEGTLIDAVVEHAPEIAKVGEDPMRPGIVSRLDKDVSGLVVIAKTQAAFESLKRQFAQHSVQKTYTALVYGEMEQEEGDIKFRIARSTSKARMSAIPEGSDAGQAAWTHYETQERFRDASLLKVEIFSGRTHQIRAHLFAAGHPIVGDILYQPKSIKRKIETNRLLLQSTSLDFIDPATDERKHFELPLDEDFQNVLKTLKTSSR
jgi:23S rRNA pseudouridine1911/1915/1917 synthase